jgi:hypothetical protein
MAFLIAVLTLVLVALVVAVVGAPLRRVQAGPGDLESSSPSEHDDASMSAASASQIEDLESAREAKYREIRDAELDFRTGKLSREDYDAIDSDLRAEALVILNRLGPAEDESTVDAELSGPGALEQQERVQEEQHAEEDGPAV